MLALYTFWYILGLSRLYLAAARFPEDAPSVCPSASQCKSAQVMSMLVDPNVDSPANIDAAVNMKNDYEGWKKKAPSELVNGLDGVFVQQSSFSGRSTGVCGVCNASKCFVCLLKKLFSHICSEGMNLKRLNFYCNKSWKRHFWYGLA